MQIALLLLAFVATGATAAPVEVAPGIFFLAGDYVPGQQPDGNTTMIRTADGFVVVDTGRHVEHTRTLLDVARAQKAGVIAVVNTHWHLDHTGGNVLIRREVPDAKIYASPAIGGALTGFLANYAKQLEEVIAKSEEGSAAQKSYRTELGLIEAGKQLAPDEVITTSGRRTIGGATLDVHLETNAVTAGDLWLFEPKSKTLIAGDLVTLPYPFLDTACPPRWKSALDALASVDFAILLPGHGAPMTRREFEQYRTAYGNLLTCGASTRTNEECAGGRLKDAGTFVKHDPAFVRQALDYYLDGFLRPNADTARLCGASK
jgi:glyoxylase-like metal-dependent hydrolase (beta-lactamase superfamily II)